MRGRVPIVVCGVVLLLVGCEARTPPSPAVPHDQITQISLINALMLGQYDGVLTIRELMHYGDFGLGTLDHLDGELIVLEGKVYQARGDGVVRGVDPGQRTPFAVVTPFEVDGRRSYPAIGSLTELESHLDFDVGERNSFLAVRVDGRFPTIRFRSVPRQEPPYEPLAEVAKRQSVWDRRDVDGTLIGIRSPKWVTNLNVPGYHWHFVSNDRRVGGHVIDASIRDAKVAYDVCDSWLVKLDRSARFEGANLSQDLSHDLEHVERSRGKD